MGRPLKSVEGEGQVIIGLRVASALKRALLQAAKENHRTLSQETQRRLELSFEADATNRPG
jgi:hypothetical protein